MITWVVTSFLVAIWIVGGACTLLGLVLLFDHLRYKVQAAWVVREDAQLAIQLLRDHRKKQGKQ